MSILSRRTKSCTETSYFLKFAKNETSQCGEDGILREIFRLVGFSSSQPICVDVGAWDGIHLSNTRSLLAPTSGENLQWSGYLFEANEERAQMLSELYNERHDIVTSSSFVEITGDNSLPFLLDQLAVPKQFDFLSIDIDGADYHIWASCRPHYRPRVVCIEFNPTIPTDVFFVQEPDCSIHKGSSLLAIVELATSLGYSLACVTTFNAIFVREDLFPLLNLQENSIDALHASTMITQLFQTYEGELLFVGPKKLIWHKLAMNPQRLQVLPKKNRKFPYSPLAYAKNRELEIWTNSVVDHLHRYCQDICPISDVETTILKCIDVAANLIVHTYLEAEIRASLAKCLASADVLSGGYLSSSESFCGDDELTFIGRICDAIAGVFLKFAAQALTGGRSEESIEYMINAYNIFILVDALASQAQYTAGQLSAFYRENGNFFEALHWSSRTNDEKASIAWRKKFYGGDIMKIIPDSYIEERLYEAESVDLVHADVIADIVADPIADPVTTIDGVEANVAESIATAALAHGLEVNVSSLYEQFGFVVVGFIVGSVLTSTVFFSLMKKDKR